MPAEFQDDIVAEGYDVQAVGKSLSDSKQRYLWRLRLEGQHCVVIFTNSRVSGRKRITVNGQLEHEKKVFLSHHFKHSWKWGNFLLSILPVWGVGETVYRSFDLSINGRPFSTFWQLGKAGAERGEAKVTVRLKSASGLRRADWAIIGGKSDPYCICMVPGRPDSRFQTKVKNQTLDPVWNHEQELARYTAGEPLEFVVMDKDIWPKSDDFLGRVWLASEQFYPFGFDGELPITEAGVGIHATLRLQVLVADTPEERNLRAIFERCDGNRDGQLNKRELIKILRADQEVADVFGLPQQIRQEDGSRELMEGVFQAMDKNDDRESFGPSSWRDHPLRRLPGRQRAGDPGAAAVVRALARKRRHRRDRGVKAGQGWRRL
eukprot:CAMPEP_0180758920 /NCGR_PEP_ID=MMETSP1038_2-20121128/35532_1 /TAXON_ID=632150 /ORGANISM="Azadinium spinosum, Strain 3D9" /LENGTH=376 /DNA_ID=CAMNT_0022793023 /DNA_START=32 /DNA_END=1158 /DNA_ORIENTATION=+